MLGLGAVGSPLGEYAIDTRQFSCAVASKNDEVTIDLVNDTPGPSIFIGAAWDGFFVNRARRI
ncbi:hypothetical protein OLF92_10755, partial [Streptococcus pneumoniae]|nr:hypothetical protein [Streptococcus pneumoniae]